MLKRTTYTQTLSEKNITRQAFVIDAKKQKLGRLASLVAIKLIGKEKVNYVPNLDMGDYVIVVNAGHLDLDPRKLSRKQYTRYSGYQSGLKTVALADLWPKQAERVVEQAIKGMLPDNKLKKNRLKRLFVFRNQDYSVPNFVKNLIVQ